MWFIKRCERSSGGVWRESGETEVGWGIFYTYDDGGTVITHFDRTYQIIRRAYESASHDPPPPTHTRINYSVGCLNWTRRGYKIL